MTSRLDLWRDGVAVESAEQPQDQKHYNDQPNRATQAIVAVSIVSVVATTAAQQDDHQKNNQKRAHAYSLDPVGAPYGQPDSPRLMFAERARKTTESRFSGSHRGGMSVPTRTEHAGRRRRHNRGGTDSLSPGLPKVEKQQGVQTWTRIGWPARPRK